MKKMIAILTAAGVCASALTVFAGETEVETEAGFQKAEYTVYNTTGAEVTELYLYSADSGEKGDNLAADGVAKGEAVVITREATVEEAEAAVYVLEFVGGEDDAQKFETLHFEVAPISLKSVDAAAGATPIAFEAPTEHAEYIVYNTTGATLTELYLYDEGSETKGRNLAGEGIADGESIVLTRDASKEEAEAAVYVLEFIAEGMDAQKFETLHFETVPISLKSVDAAAGATPIVFAEPEA